MNEQIVLVATPNDYSIRRRGWLLRGGIIRELEKVPFLLDVTASLSCKSYSRRLARKTQVFGPKRGINIRTRLVHTQDLCEAARKASYMLKLNEALTEVISLGHDVGHFSYGHVGEKVASREMSKRAGYEVEVDHGTISSIILQVVEAGGHGLNLDRRALHGITYHSISSPEPSITPEGELVRLLDKVAYLSGDVNDTIRAYEQELIELPDNLVSEMRWRASLLGENQHLFLTNCVIDLVNESREKGYVSFSDCPRAEALWSFRKFMYKNIYDKIDWSLEERYLKNIFEFFTGFSMRDGCDPALLLACLTEDEATMLGNQLEHELRPSYEEFTKLGFYELLPIFRGLGMVNLTDPQLDEDMFHTSFH